MSTAVRVIGTSNNPWSAAGGDGTTPRAGGMLDLRDVADFHTGDALLRQAGESHANENSAASKPTVVVIEAGQAPQLALDEHGTIVASM